MELLRPLLAFALGVAAAIVFFLLGIDQYVPAWLHFGRGRPVTLSIAGPARPGRCGIRYVVDNDTDRALFVSWNVPPASSRPDVWPADESVWGNGWQAAAPNGSLLPAGEQPRPPQADYYNPAPTDSGEPDTYQEEPDSYEGNYDADSYDRYGSDGGTDRGDGGTPPPVGFDPDSGNYVSTTPAYPPAPNGYPPPPLTGGAADPDGPVPANAVELQPGGSFTTPQSGYAADYRTGYDGHHARCDPGAHDVSLEVHS